MTKAASANSKNEESRESITIDDETFYVGDCILVKGDGTQQPFVRSLAKLVGNDIWGKAWRSPTPSLRELTLFSCIQRLWPLARLRRAVSYRRVCIVCTSERWLYSVLYLQIGRIRSFGNKSRGLRYLKINVYWFYRPEECKAGRRVS